MIVDDIRNYLFVHQDKAYASFQSKLIPSIDAKTMIGVRTPILRSYAKKCLKEASIQDFLDDLPHQYFEENQLHSFIISSINDYQQALDLLIKFLPMIDNWATCDQCSPKIFKKYKAQLIPKIIDWLCDDHEYTVRFAISMLMEHYLEDDFKIEYPQWVAQIQKDEYYIKMMIAWYFATGLAKQPESFLPFFEKQTLPLWTHHKAIQKAIESHRISDECKAYLKTLKK